jgi:hypothetical protein
MEPSRRNQWQAPANRPAVETAGTSQICCRGLQLIAAGVTWGSTVRVRQRALQKRRTPALFVQIDLLQGERAVGMDPSMELSGSNASQFVSR